jgi:dephospho-CoA kinase
MDVQLARLMKRDNCTKKEAEDRINSQMKLDEKVKFADKVIDNGGTLSELEERVLQTWNGISGGGWSWLISWLLPPVGIGLGLTCLLRRNYLK